MRTLHHAGGLDRPEELLFDTPFDYLFPYAARSIDCLIVSSPDTVAQLLALGDAMADPGTEADPRPGLDAGIPAVFTYLGQFIDHDITARTDRDSALSSLASTATVFRNDPDDVIVGIVNGRRPQLDLESVYGDGPAFAPNAVSEAEAFGLYKTNLRMQVFQDADGLDLPRQSAGPTAGTAIIADMRNDENVIVSQLHAAFLAFHNAVADALPGPAVARFVRARQLVRWCYQYIVLNEYLPMVCDTGVVADVVANGPRLLGPSSGRTLFMPLEFSVAGFRFAHSMIRPFYRLNSSTTATIDQLFFPGKNPAALSGGQLKAALRVDWSQLVGPAAQSARKIDPRLAMGLSNLSFGGGDPILKHLARRNLLRGFSLSIPTGQAVAACLGVVPLSAAELTPSSGPLKTAMEAGYLAERTPLWYYVLREAAVQHQGRRLGEVGSRLVVETILGLIVGSTGGYLASFHDDAVSADGIAIPGEANPVRSIADLLRIAGVL